MSRSCVFLLAVASAACTFDDGTGFATLKRASLTARFEPGIERELGGNAILTDLGYQVSLSSLILEARELRLEEHAGEGGPATLASLPVEQDVDARLGPTLSLTRVEPSAELPQATLARVALALDGARIEGSVSGGALLAALPFSVALGSLGAVSQSLDFHIDRDAPETLELSAALTVDGTLFDGIDFAPLAAAPPLALTDPDDPTLLAIAQHLLASSFSAELAESEK